VALLSEIAKQKLQQNKEEDAENISRHFCELKGNGRENMILYGLLIPGMKF
jgi:hypothetical protein